MRPRPTPILALVATSSLLACAHYRPAPLDPERPLRTTGADVPASPLSFDEAVRFAVAHNPDLVALRARAAAVNVDPPREPVEAGGGVDMDHRGELSVSLDALSLLGLGVRPHEVALACARRSEATSAHHARAREIAGEIAECFAVERALSALVEPDAHVDVSSFVRAGLESSAAQTASEATAASGDAERAARVAEREANRAVLARLLGVAPGTVVHVAPVAADWPAVARPTPTALALSLGEVQRRIAAFEVADRDVRRAVAAQYPSVMLEPGFSPDPAALFGAVRLKLPVGLAPEVCALEAAREAARADVESAVLDGVREADESRARWTSAGAALSAARKRVESSAAMLKGARIRLEVSTSSPIETVLATDAVVDAAVAVRMASVDEARARVRAARAAGWPSPLP